MGHPGRKTQYSVPTRGRRDLQFSVPMSESGFRVAQYSVWGVDFRRRSELPPSPGAMADAMAGRDGVAGWNERGRGKTGRRLWLSLFTLYRVTNFVTHGFWEAARAVKGGRARRFLQIAQDFGDFWVGHGRNKYFCGWAGFEVSALQERFTAGECPPFSSVPHYEAGSIPTLTASSPDKTSRARSQSGGAASKSGCVLCTGIRFLRYLRFLLFKIGVRSCWSAHFGPHVLSVARVFEKNGLPANSSCTLSPCYPLRPHTIATFFERIC